MVAYYMPGAWAGDAGPSCIVWQHHSGGSRGECWHQLSRIIVHYLPLNCACKG